MKILLICVQNFLRYIANRQTDTQTQRQTNRQTNRQTDKQTNADECITSLAEAITITIIDS